MMRMVSRMLLVIGTLGAVAVAGACGQPGVTNTSGHGLRWQRVSASSGPHPSWSRGIPDSIWYNRCARRVEWFVKYTQSGSTLFYWSGSQWHPTRLSPAFEQVDTNGVAAWNSDTCTVVGIGKRATFPRSPVRDRCSGLHGVGTVGLGRLSALQAR